jgi:succinoglycan biosynthesis transport protein ExoP
MQQVEANPRQSVEPRNFLDDIHFYVGVFQRGWKLIVIGLVIGLVIATIHLARSKTAYRASARILLIQQAGRPLSGASGNDPFRNSQDAADSLATHLMLMRSPVIVEQAIKSSGLGDLSPGAVIDGLTAKQPDPAARIVEITYKSGSSDQASKVVDGVMRSYNGFLKENFQKNTNDVISLILKARDELSKELTSLERQYLDYRQKNPAYSADERGRSFIVRRLDQWDQSMNQVLARSLQLKSQLELGKKLAAEGLDQETITNALNQLGGMGGNTAVTPLTSGTARVGSGLSIDKLREELADIEFQRLGAELLLTHLRRELAESAASSEVSDRDLANAFYADPDVAKLQDERKQKQSALQNALRLARSADDPAVIIKRTRIKELDEEIQLMWQYLKPILAARLANDSNAEISASVRKAEVDLVNLKAKHAALNEQMGRLASGQLERLRKDRERLIQLQGENQPQVRLIDQQIAQIERGTDDSTGRNPGGLKNDALLESIARSLEAIEAMRADIQAKFDEDLDASKKTEIGQLGEANMRNNLDRQRTLFNSVVDQLKQAQLVSDFGSVSAQTINPTQVAAEPPKYMSTMVMALLGGCGVGMLGAYFVELLDARVRTVAEMREMVGLPVLGMIPQLSSEQIGVTGKVGLLSHEIPRSALAESYKSTRTNLEFLRRNRRAQVLLVTSPQSGDGKSTTASNLAITMSHAGRRVLLIDGDLRKPSQHLNFNLSLGRGFTDAIEGVGSIGQFAISTLVDNLDLLVTGSHVTNPAELLASPRLGEILDRARDAYDIIIIDSSPLLAVTDPSIIAAVADGILLVVRVARTRRYDVGRTKELLETMGLPVLGVVINGILKNQLGYGHGYGYGYGAYGYGSQNRATNSPMPDGAAAVAAQPLASSHSMNGMNGRIEFDAGTHELG